MSLSVKKGGRVLLLGKDGKSLDNIKINIGWNANAFDTGSDFDLDVTIVCLKNDPTMPYGKGYSEDYVVYYNAPKSRFGEIVHGGDNLTGGGEVIDIPALSKLPADIDKFVVLVTIHDAINRKQNFGMVTDAYVNICDQADGGKEVLRFDLSEDSSDATAVLFAEIYRKGSGWSFKAANEGFNQGLGDFLKLYGFDTD